MPVDMSAATMTQQPPKAPPARRGRPPGSTNKARTDTPPQPSQLEVRTVGLMGLGQLAQGGLMISKQYADAAAIGMHWQGIAVEVAKLSETQPAIAGVVDTIIQAGPYAALITAVMPLAMQLAVNHGLIPMSAGLTGVIPPDILKTQMESQMLQMQADAMRQQQQARMDAEAAKNDLEAFMASDRSRRQGEIRDGVENRGWDPALHGVNGERPSV